MDAITFTVYGEPKGKQRPRFSRQGNAVRTYTPSQTVAYENEIKEAFNKAGGSGFWCGKDEYFNMCVLCYFPMPKRTPQKKRMKMLSVPPEIYPKKPDCDNIAKAVADALNEVAFYDDSRMCRLMVSKAYTQYEPRIVVFIAKTEKKDENNENTGVQD